jgi:hypothetical protein
LDHFREESEDHPQAGLRVTWTGKLCALFHNMRQVENTSTSGGVANNVSFIGEWYPRENFWPKLSLGQTRPGVALAPSALSNPFAFLNEGVAPVETRNSFDVVFAAGWRFFASCSEQEGIY